MLSLGSQTNGKLSFILLHFAEEEII